MGYYEPTARQDALQWAIEQADKQMPRDQRNEVEKLHLHELEQLRNTYEQNKRANRAPSV